MGQALEFRRRPVGERLLSYDVHTSFPVSSWILGKGPPSGVANLDLIRASCIRHTLSTNCLPGCMQARLATIAEDESLHAAPWAWFWHCDSTGELARWCAPTNQVILIDPALAQPSTTSRGQSTRPFLRRPDK